MDFIDLTAAKFSTASKRKLADDVKKILKETSFEDDVIVLDDEIWNLESSSNAKNARLQPTGPKEDNVVDLCQEAGTSKNEDAVDDEDEMLLVEIEETPMAQKEVSMKTQEELGGKNPEVSVSNQTEKQIKMPTFEAGQSFEEFFANNETTTFDDVDEEIAFWEKFDKIYTKKLTDKKTYKTQSKIDEIPDLTDLEINTGLKEFDEFLVEKLKKGEEIILEDIVGKLKNLNREFNYNLTEQNMFDKINKFEKKFIKHQKKVRSKILEIVIPVDFNQSDPAMNDPELEEKLRKNAAIAVKNRKKCKKN